MIKGNAPQLRTALTNLIFNSVEAMPQGGEITVSARTILSDGFVAITISDTGPGMTSDVIEKVCEPFFSTKLDEGLRGLGLAIVRDIVKTHGGKMEIKSSPDEGTSIIIFLPVFKDNERCN